MSSSGAIMPEDAIGPGSLVFRISLENVFFREFIQRIKFVRVKTRVARVSFEQTQAFPNGFKAFGKGWRIFEGIELLLRP